MMEMNRFLAKVDIRGTERGRTLVYVFSKGSHVAGEGFQKIYGLPYGLPLGFFMCTEDPFNLKFPPPYDFGRMCSVQEGISPPPGCRQEGVKATAKMDQAPGFPKQPPFVNREWPLTGNCFQFV